ncbi:CDP-diacylglycerol diphosphatase [Pantoea eucrina]|uniref:CDP-diacylglycerol pyrophosphatase n=1 Tax=Pantoea eucrina TaxID=472693 RepID=A0ABU5LAB0_9GAMM|nr:CDP-diacylglycerol diphosphatase [Pantoea eucrina]MDZ7276869.1 CDP-diacylglycerol diphosphatase [Pantoea eucrina]
MRERRYALKVLMISVLTLIVALIAGAWHWHSNADALWQIVSEKCVPNMARTGDPAPCDRVNTAQGFVILKDRNGPLQYLLIPIARITGMESPALLQQNTPNFFAEAWQARGRLAQKRGAPIADSALSLAINSQYGRTQNQLHIHLSCLRPDVRRQLNRLNPQFSARWQPIRLLQHRYLIRTLSESELNEESAFLRLAKEIPAARSAMGEYGLALTTLPDGRLALLAVARSWLTSNRGSAEELQDHQCKILQQL